MAKPVHHEKNRTTIASYFSFPDSPGSMAAGGGATSAAAAAAVAAMAMQSAEAAAAAAAAAQQHHHHHHHHHHSQQQHHGHQHPHHQHHQAHQQQMYFPSQQQQQQQQHQQQQQLQHHHPDFHRQLQSIYGDHFPLEARHALAGWIETAFLSAAAAAAAAAAASEDAAAAAAAAAAASEEEVDEEQARYVPAAPKKIFSLNRKNQHFGSTLSFCRSLAVSLIQRLEAKAAETPDFALKAKFAQIAEGFKVGDGSPVFLSAAKPRPWNCRSCCCCCFWDDFQFQFFSR